MKIHFALDRLSLLAAVTLFLSLIVAGCGKQEDAKPPVTGGTAPAVPAQPVPAEVRIGYFANLTHAQAVLGVASGDYKKAVAPGKLSTKVFNAGPSLIEALFANEIDFGYVGPGPAINAYSQTRGEGIRVISGAAANGVVIVARPGSGIERFEDLKGRKIATPQLGNTQDISARHFLVAKLGQADTSNVVSISNAEQSAMMSQGQIDAAWAPEPWGSKLVAEAGGKIIAQEKDLWPGAEFGLTTVVTTPEFLAKHPDVIRKLLTVHTAWTDRLSRDPVKYAPDLAAALTKLTGKKISESLMKDAVVHVKFTDDPMPSTLKSFAQWSYDLKYLKSITPTEGLVDTSILRSIAVAQPAPAK